VTVPLCPRPAVAALVAALTAALTLGVGPAQADAAASAPGPGGATEVPTSAAPVAADQALVGTDPSQPPTTGSWKRPDESVEASPGSVVEAAAPEAGAKTPLRVVSVVNRDGAPQVVVDPVRGRSDAVAAVDEAQSDDDLVAVSVDTRVRVADSGLDALAATSDDAYRGYQWALDRLHAEDAWETATGAGAVVAVVDTGVDGSHPDLLGRLTTDGHDYITGAGDGRLDENSHGTHVAGIIAATSGNRVGTAGLAPQAKIMPLRVLDASGAGWSSDIAKAIMYATDHGADVVNLSLGGPDQDSVTATAVKYAVSHGVIVLAAAGNERTTGNATSYPAAYPGVIAVASTDQGDASSSFSNTGTYVDVSAPGGRILSTVPGSWAYKSGTSMATPYVSAAAALAVDATDGAITPATFEQAVTGSAEDLGTAGWDPQFGFGLISPLHLLATLTPVASTPVSQPSGATDPQPVASPAGSQPVTAPAPEPAPGPAPAPEPEPGVVDDPAPGTEPAPQPDPRTDPAPKHELRVDFAVHSGRAFVNQRKPVRIHVTDTATGAAVAGQPVRIVGHAGGDVVASRWVLTDSAGSASARFRIRTTTRFSASISGDARTEPARTASTLRWRAVPRVRVHHRVHRVTVRVLAPMGQRVKLQERHGRRWRTVVVRELNSHGRTSVRGLDDGTFRAVVTAAAGVGPVRTAPWRA